MDLTINQRRLMIEKDNPNLSIARQCDILDINRSSFYYCPKQETDFNLLLMRLIDEQYTETPFYGSPRMTAILKRKGYLINHKRVERLMHKMGIMAIYPKPRTSIPNYEHKIYPYLLRRLDINKPNQVWCADITYVRMNHGFLYLFAILDWYSRYVITWELSNTLDSQFCVDGLKRALKTAQPEIFNTDQGSQFTSKEFTGILDSQNIQISMDGRGRMYDNIFIERLWRSVKQEEIYLHDYQDGIESFLSLVKYFQFYNEERPHSSLGYNTPSEIYHGIKKEIVYNEKIKEKISVLL